MIIKSWFRAYDRRIANPGKWGESIILIIPAEYYEWRSHEKALIFLIDMARGLVLPKSRLGARSRISKERES
jgi:hypothetical protein